MIYSRRLNDKQIKWPDQVSRNVYCLLEHSELGADR